MISGLVEQGATRLFGVVDVANRHSYSLLRWFGYRECGVKVTHYRLLGRRWARLGTYAGTLLPTRGQR